MDMPTDPIKLWAQRCRQVVENMNLKNQYDTIHSFDNSNYTFTSKQRLHAKCNYNVGYKMA